MLKKNTLFKSFSIALIAVLYFFALTEVIKVYNLYKFTSSALPQITLCELQKEFCFNENLGKIAKPAEVIVTADTGLFLNQKELSIIAMLSKKANNIFEFGTGTGRTAWVMAKNSPINTRILTINLSPHMAENIAIETGDADYKQYIKSDSQYTKFFFEGSDIANKISLQSIDSKNFNETKHSKKYDLIFVDGAHTYSYIKNDTEKAFKMLTPGGTILWDDYSFNENEDVMKYLNKLGQEKKLFHITDTKFVIFKDE